MTAQEIFRRIAEVLDQAGIPYMLTGSFASSYHGVPRATQDIDIVISATPDQLRSLVRLLPDSEYYVDLEAVLDAQRRQTQFNLVDLATGWKVDLIIRKSRPFSSAEFDRRTAIDFQGLRLFIASAEDVIVSKLEWAKLGQSERQIEDVSGILRIRWGELDRAYIERWVRDLDLQSQWEAACRTAGVAV
ncbi:MAG: hypothetical protein HYY65_06860 [Candidatus Tectomicrobia bacterium]|uniref:DUF6036 domain-containing protein n=1 Tax=Tectimicrobiota bacterium TaxID=2528274 RepID=A0A932M0D5_UNCTE|nr:hypothetical protein [Candidatus Tectomicrobia bacterium]